MKKKKEVLGEKLYITILKLQGVLPPEEMAKTLEEVVSLAGMRTGGLKAKIWTYPLDTFGTGGIGSTIVQPLVESFLISDDWQDLNHTFIILASCRQYSTQEIILYLAKRIGPIINMKTTEI